MCTRIEVYKDAGYFDPGEAETLKELSRAVEVRHPMTVLANFVRPAPALTVDPREPVHRNSAGGLVSTSAIPWRTSVSVRPTTVAE